MVLTIDVQLLSTIMVCDKCGHEMLAIDVKVIDTDIACPICKSPVSIKKDEN